MKATANAEAPKSAAAKASFVGSARLTLMPLPQSHGRSTAHKVLCELGVPVRLALDEDADHDEVARLCESGEFSEVQKANQEVS